MATEVIYRKNPLFGQPGEPEMLPPETVVHQDATPPLDASAQRRAMVLGRARELDKKGKYLEAGALRATIGE